MKWPNWLPPWSNARSDRDDTHEKAQAYQWEESLNSHYTTTQTISLAVLASAATLAAAHTYKTYLRRIPTIDHLKPGFFHKRSFYGYVARVGDGDNFHLFHTPGGRLMGWGWLPGRQISKMQNKDFKGKTWHVRIAGVDAPELAHFGRPAQPYGQEAIEWLTGHILHRYVRVWPYRRDQYERVVASVERRRFLLFKTDVGLNMIRNGLATVYEAKMGSEFGALEQEYRDAEARAKEKGTGMWQRPGLVAKFLGQKEQKIESPRAYKTRTARQEKEVLLKGTKALKDTQTEQLAR